MNKVIFGKTEIATLVALTEEEQGRGLMGCAWPPPVMSFPFDQSRVSKFWMKNTPSPLDIVFCYAGKVISIETGIPNSEIHVGPDSLTDLVVELPSGAARRLNIESGTPVRLAYDLTTLARKVGLHLAKQS